MTSRKPKEKHPTLYYHRNQQYSVTALTDATGTISERYAYDAYGKLSVFDGSGTVISGSAYGNRYTYTGREWDDLLGLYHYRARMYDPVAGRFCSRDPIGYEGTMSQYRYLGAGMLSDLDPSGLLSKKQCEGKLEELQIHLDEIYDHWSPNHCAKLKSELKRFKDEGCKRWANSFIDKLEDLTRFYNEFCPPPPEDKRRDEWEEYWPFGEAHTVCDRWTYNPLRDDNPSLQSCPSPLDLPGMMRRSCLRVGIYIIRIIRPKPSVTTPVPVPVPVPLPLPNAA